MTTEQKAAPAPKAPKSNGNASANAAGVPSSAPDSWRKVQTERACWKPDNDACSQTVQGYLLSLIDDLPRPDGGTWSAYVMRLTAPAMVAPAFGDGEPVSVAAGVEIMLPCSAKLIDLKRALNPRVLIEVRITNLGLVKLGEGRTMRRYDVATNDASVIPRPAALPLGTSARLALPAVAPAPVADPTRDPNHPDYIPF
jgi:hypothetical protein